MGCLVGACPVAECKNVCHRIPFVKGYPCRLGNNKACITCRKSFPYEGRFCPCCGTRLRHKPRFTKAQEVPRAR